MTVAELLERVSSRELTEWFAYFRLEHIGLDPNERADLRAGIVASTIANANRGKGKAIEPAEMMPKFERPQQSPEDLHAAMLGLAKRRGGKIAGEAGNNGNPK